MCADDYVRLNCPDAQKLNVDNSDRSESEDTEVDDLIGSEDDSENSDRWVSACVCVCVCVCAYFACRWNNNESIIKNPPVVLTIQRSWRRRDAPRQAVVGRTDGTTKTRAKTSWSSMFNDGGCSVR